ncbi:MAG: hypothetical protein KDD56_03825, partial [Bdellovibrionales bacterium]|nr:hypothetical protein [Bdellovibrionales bacterium]
MTSCNLFAADVSWISNASGNWSDGSNWDRGVPPEIGDRAIIDVPSADITVSINNQNIEILSISSEESLSITSGSLTVSETSNIDGSLSLNNKALLKVNGGVTSIPFLTSLSNAELTVEDGAEISAPNLTVFNGLSTLKINGTGKLSSGMLIDIKNLKFFLTGGAVFDRVAATSYNTTGLSPDVTVISVKDAGSRLDLSSVTNLDFGWYASGQRRQLYEALDGGVIDFSGATNLKSYVGEQDDWIEFKSTNSGQILFSSLKNITSNFAPAARGSVRFNLEGNTNPLPLVEDIHGLGLTVSAGTTINLP